MAKKKISKKVAKKEMGVGALAGFAGVLLLFASSFNQSLAMNLVIMFLLGFSGYKYLSSK